jgi:hypothetical protein
MRKTTIYIGIIAFLSYCTTPEKIPTKQDLSLLIKKSEFYQKNKIQSKNSSFEKPSSRTKFLILREENGELIAKELEVGFFAYNDSFMEKIRSIFQNETLKKYYLEEIVKKGKILPLENKEEFKIVFTEYLTRKTESDNLLEAIDDLVNEKYKRVKRFNEQITYSLKEDGNLWKMEETVSMNKNKKLNWKNYREESIFNNTLSYTEFKGHATSSYSKIQSEENYLLKPINYEQGKLTKLFQNKDYMIYYFPEEDYNFGDKNLVAMTRSKKKLELYKNKLPILVYKKTLNIDGSQN